MSLRRNSTPIPDDTDRASQGGATEWGRGLMEVIIGILVLAIVGSVSMHFIHLGYAMYNLNNGASEVADTLNKAREIAMRNNKKVMVIFDTQNGKYGIDQNGNGRLDGGEADELPEGIGIADSSEGYAVTFLPSGNLPPRTKPPQIVISNERNSKSVSVSSMGAVNVE